jgi:hypothetical protein
MLKDMLQLSRDDWKTDIAAYEKFEVYCKENTESRTEALDTSVANIALLTNKIAELKGSNGVLSVGLKQLTAEVAENAAARAEATSMRDKELAAYTAEKADLETGIAQMEEATKILSELSADKEIASGTFMSAYGKNTSEKSLLSIQASVKHALTAASSLLEPAKKTKVLAFMQNPFGKYTSQSSQVVQILKDMANTFEQNLNTAEANEATAAKANAEFMKNKEEEAANIQASLDDKEANTGANDMDLALKKTQLQQNEEQRAEVEELLAALNTQRTEKKKAFESRKVYAENEDVALSKAILMLDNNATTKQITAIDDATAKTGSAVSLLQLSALSKRREAAHLLQKAASSQHSARLSKVAMLLRNRENPFSVIVEEITKAEKLSDEEQVLDDEQKSHCENINKDNAASLAEITAALDTVKGDITDLMADIDNPETGLKKQMADVEESLKTNLANQANETQTRSDDNIAYQKLISTMEDGVATVSKAEQFLTSYYESLDNEQIGLIQKQTPEDSEGSATLEDAPATFEGSYQGQNAAAKNVLGMLAQIKEEAVAADRATHDNELIAQHAYEDSMKALTDNEKENQETIVKLNKLLSGMEKELLAKRSDQTSSEKSQTALERYVEKMKPGCDAVLLKYDERKAGRVLAKKALATALETIKGSAAYKVALETEA